MLERAERQTRVAPRPLQGRPVGQVRAAHPRTAEQHQTTLVQLVSEMPVVMPARRMSQALVGARTAQPARAVSLAAQPVRVA